MAPKRGIVKHRSPLPYGVKNSPERRKLFLDQLALGKSPAYACRAADIGYSTAHDWRKNDAEFAAQWALAVEEGVDLLEDEARRRAYEGCEKPVFQGGIEVGRIREYSDTLMTVLLKGRRKQVFADRVEQTGPDGGPVRHEMEVTFVDAKGGKK